VCVCCFTNNVWCEHQVFGESHPDTLAAMNNLAISLAGVGRHREALNLQTTVLEKRRRLQGPKHPHTIRAMHNLAGSMFAVGRRDEALALWKEAVPLAKEVFGKMHPSTINYTKWYSKCLGAMGHTEKSAKQAKRAARAQKKARRAKTAYKAAKMGVRIRCVVCETPQSAETRLGLCTECLAVYYCSEGVGE
jgi:predicted O-linked N-acetylglucosamine transferase (SPINDLY family)